MEIEIFSVMLFGWLAFALVLLPKRKAGRNEREF